MFNSSGKYKTSKCEACIKEYNKKYRNNNKELLAENKEYFGNKSKEHYTNLEPFCSKLNRDIKKNKNYEEIFKDN